MGRDTSRSTRWRWWYRNFFCWYAAAGVLVQIGLHVNFLKSTILASKIRAGTTEETTKSQGSLFHAAREACREYTGEPSTSLEEEEDDDDEQEGDDDETFPEKQQPCGPFGGIFGFCVGGRRRKDAITESVESALNKLQQVDSSLQKQEEDDDGAKVEIMQTELKNLHMALDKLLGQMQQ